MLTAEHYNCVWYTASVKQLVPQHVSISGSVNKSLPQGAMD